MFYVLSNYGWEAEFNTFEEAEYYINGNDSDVLWICSDDEEEEDFEEDFEKDYGYEYGFDPYMGCYSYDC